MKRLERFSSREAVYAQAATRIEQRLIQAVASRGKATFAGSGGSTPAPVYEILSAAAKVPWENVRVTLTDERQDAADDGLDNARLVRRGLMKAAAKHARFVPLDGKGALAGIPLPMDVVLLGMGGDGHIASIFPAGDGMKEALKAAPGSVVETTPSPLPSGAPYKRWTLSLSTIATAKSIILLVTGEEKLSVLETAATKEGKGLPIRKLMKDPDLPMEILWAP